MRNFEDVSGIVVGGFSCKVCLIDPNGCIVDYKIVPNDSDFGILAVSMKILSYLKDWAMGKS